MAKKGLPAFKDTPEEAERMQRLVDEYFNVYCEGVVLTTDTGKPVFNKYGDVVVVGVGVVGVGVGVCAPADGYGARPRARL